MLNMNISVNLTHVKVSPQGQKNIADPPSAPVTNKDNRYSTLHSPEVSAENRQTENDKGRLQKYDNSKKRLETVSETYPKKKARRRRVSRTQDVDDFVGPSAIHLEA